MSENLIFEKEARDKLVLGAEKVYKAVSITLGAKGQTVIIKVGNHNAIVTKDGVTVAKYVSTVDKAESAGLELVQEAAMATNSIVGDGTTTATVLAYNILKEGNDVINKDVATVFLKRGLDKAMFAVIDKLQTMASKDFSTADIATISANGDRVIANKIAEAFELVGVNGIINIEPSQTEETYLEREDGMRLDKGLLSPIFINSPSNDSCEFKKCKVLLINGAVMTPEHIQYHALAAKSLNSPLVVIADSFGGEVVSLFGRNKIEGKLEVALIESPLHGKKRTVLMKDLAKLTGAKLIGEELGNIKHLGATGKDTEERKLSAIKMLGDLNGFKSTQDSSLLMYDSNKEYIDLISKNIDKGDDFARQRIAMLNNGMATIYVGGNSEIEIKEFSHRIEDAVNSTRAALSHGVVAGGGLALLEARNVIKKLTFSTPSEQAGADILYKTLASPAQKIIDNAGVDYDIYSNVYPFGYDVMTDEVKNLLEAGIIDPVKVTIEALRNSVSVASTILSSGAIVIKD